VTELAGADASLVVSEVFGPTWQGEGPSLGRRCGFVRLGRCNLACTWCDTAYTWDWDRFDPAVELTARPIADLLREIEAMHVDMLVVIGGEPMLQQRHLRPLVSGAAERGWRVELETAGTIAPGPAVDAVDAFNVSPKLTSSGNQANRRYRPDVLRAFQSTGRAVFKFVATGDADLDEIGAIVDECHLEAVWVMPEGTDAETLLQRSRILAPAVMERGWNFTSRLHVLLWGDRRGV
jgi:7-cyano-7-deazaguanosine (preQ0) biosynthesis protein QueE